MVTHCYRLTYGYANKTSNDGTATETILRSVFLNDKII
jgi:hypothetical protein